MGKELQQSNYYRIHLQNQQQQQPGRFWGMFHVLDYHHWDYVKKILHKKHVGKNRLRCCVAPRTVSFNLVNGEEHVDDESEHLLLEHRVQQNCSLELDSSKKILAEETSQDLVISNPITVLHGASHPRGNDDRFHGRLSKARSFPVRKSDTLETKLYRSSTMDHKQNEVWLLPKGEKPLNIVTLDSPKDSKQVQFDGTMKDSSSKHGWKINPFKGFKKKIKRALLETRKEEVDINKTNQPRITRLSSLNESIEKYTRLFEGSYGKETAKLENDKSFKVAVEDSKVTGHKSWRRKLSLPNHDALNSLLEEVSQQNLRSEGSLARTASKDSNCVEIVYGDEPFTDDSRTDFVEDSLQRSEPEDIDLNGESAAGNGDGCAPVDATNVSKAISELQQPSSPVSVLVPVLPLEEDSTTCVATNIVTKSRCRSVEEDDPDFKFVTEILRSIGFSENDPIPTWESIQLPLTPTLYDELEASQGWEIMFDLINESLLEFYESHVLSPFSFNPYTRPFTKAKHVLDEVWMIVKFYKDMKPEIDVSLDNIVSRDMARHNGWVNPRLDSEGVVVELEDLIFSELLEEFIDILH